MSSTVSSLSSIMENYNKSVEDYIEAEFPHVNGIVYLDHTGTTLYAASQLKHYHDDLMRNIYGNPHSHCASSQLSTDTIEQVRYRILQHFNTTPDQHSVIFTSGCTGALKLLADTFDWKAQNVQAKHIGSDEASHDATESTRSTPKQTQDILPGWFCYLEDNHTSVVGMREVAKDKGAHVVSITKEKIGSCFQDVASKSNSSQKLDFQNSNSLFAYPAQSNFSGHKYSLDWCTKVKQGQLSHTFDSCHGNWYVVLDAAAMAATSPLDLSSCTADFVTVSFYKMFGFPTGLGALIVRKGAEAVLRKRYFGGGTVQAYLSGEQFHAPKSSIVDWLEDGTIPFLDIVAVQHGLDAIERLAVNMLSIQKHTFALAKYVYDKMAAFCHGNGSPVARVYCHGGFKDMEKQGPIVNFNLLRPNGDYVGYAEVDSLAALHNIHLRTGCFCNTGACQSYLGLSSKQIKDNFQAGHVCGDDMDILDGQPTGSVRISFGYMSTKADADHFLQFINDCFVKLSKPNEESDVKNDQKVLERENDKLQSTLLNESNFSSSKASPKLEESKTITFHKEVIPKAFSGSQSSHSAIIGGCNGDDDMSRGDEIARNAGSEMVLTNIFLYPIKSCGAMEVCEWELGPRGLMYDRHWMIVNSSGVSLSQKRESMMCLIKPHIDLNAGVMKLTYPGLQTIEIPLESSQVTAEQVIVSKLCHSKICGDRVEMFDCGDTAADWLEAALGKPCRLLQQNVNFKRTCKFKQALPSDQAPQLSLAQESPYLLLNRASCKALMENIQPKSAPSFENIRPISAPSLDSTDQSEVSSPPVKGDSFELENLLGRFRGNLVVDNLMSFEEDKWKKIQIGGQVFMVGGLCSRCQMICINQDTAERSKEPLMSLTTFRGKRVPFGVHLLKDPGLSTSTKICVNDKVTVLETSH